MVREPSAGPVLPGRGRQPPALLPRVRRYAGQQLGGWSVADTYPTRRAERRLVPDAGRRRLLLPDRPDQSQHRLRRVTARGAHALRPGDRRARLHPPGRRPRRGPGMALGRAPDHQPAQPGSALLRGQPRLQDRGSGVELDLRQPRPHQGHRPHRESRGVAPAGRLAVRGHRRRHDPDQRGRGRQLARHSVHRQRGARHDVRHRHPTFLARREHGLCGVRQPQGGGLPALHRQVHGPGAYLGGDPLGPARAWHGLHDPGGHQERCGTWSSRPSTTTW